MTRIVSRRRALLYGTVGALAGVAAPLLGCGVPRSKQPEPAARVYRLGYLSFKRPKGGNPDVQGSLEPLFAAFRAGLRDLGHLDGQNVELLEHAAVPRRDFLADAAEDLVRRGVDVIVAGGDAAIEAARAATASIPIIMISSADPVGAGSIASLARPGGNVTGLTAQTPNVNDRRLELIQEVVPGLARLAIVWDAQERGAERQVDELQAFARARGIETRVWDVSAPANFILANPGSGIGTRQNPIPRGSPDIAREIGADAFLGLLDPTNEGGPITPLLTTRRYGAASVAPNTGDSVPSIYAAREFALGGALLSYGPSYAALYRRAAVFVDRILKGARPSDLPVERPDRFELVVNLLNARSLGLAIPATMLARADEVIS